MASILKVSEAHDHVHDGYRRQNVTPDSGENQCGGVSWAGNEEWAWHHNGEALARGVACDHKDGLS